MNNVLVQHYLTMQWDNSWNTLLSTKTDDVISLLNSTLSDWSFEVTDVKPTKEDDVLLVALYMPGKIISGSGKTERDAISNIISLLFTNNKTDNSQVSKQETVQIPQETIKEPQVQETEQKTITTSSVLEQLGNIKNNINEQKPATEQKSLSPEDMFNMLLGMPTGTQEEPTEVEFGSPESEQFEKEFLEQVKKVEKLSPDIVNPTRRIIPKSEWIPEQGNALRQWMAKFEVTTKEQVDAWLNKFCGLTYDYFDPKFIGDFIEWTEYMREKQTY